MGIKFHKSKGQNQRFLGVEFEISSYELKWKKRIKNVVNEWGGEFKADNSIEPDDCDDCAPGECTCAETDTAEITTAPACGDKFRQQIKEICDVLKKANAKTNDSCGLHVHIDARDFEPNDIVKAGIVWGKIQNQMLKMVSKHRKGQHYCQPRQDSYDIGAIKISGVVGLLRTLIDGKRYSALNFASLTKFGTLENRLHEGTVDAAKAIKWAELNAKFMDYVKKIPYEEALTINRLSVKNIR